MSRITFYACTDRGKNTKRPVNEDSLWPEPDQTDHPEVDSPLGLLFLVADGMGGYGAGDKASQLAVKTVRQAYYASFPETNPDSCLKQAIERAHQVIKQAAVENPETANMGTTIVAAVVRDNRLWLAWIGDSRAYLLRQGQLHRLTEDHTHLWAEVKDKVKDKAVWLELHYHPQRSKLNNSLTAQCSTLTIDQRLIELQPGDQILLCSDGLTSEVYDQDIEKILTKYAPHQGGRQLIEAAKKPKSWPKKGEKVRSAGGEDNVTALIIQMPGGRPEPSLLPWRPLHLIIAGVILVTLLLGSFFFFTSNNWTMVQSSAPIAPQLETVTSLVLGQTVATVPPSIVETAFPLTATNQRKETPKPTSTLAEFNPPTPILPTATSTPTLLPRPTPTPERATSVATLPLTDTLPIPELLYPEQPEPNPVTVYTGVLTNFKWKWSGTSLPNDLGFEIRIWLKDTQPVGAYDARVMKSDDLFTRNGNEYSFSFDLSAATSVQTYKTSDEYFWSVGLVQLEPKYEWLGIESKPRRISIAIPVEGGGHKDDKNTGGQPNDGPDVGLE